MFFQVDTKLEMVRSSQRHHQRTKTHSFIFRPHAIMRQRFDERERNECTQHRETARYPERTRVAPRGRSAAEP